MEYRCERIIGFENYTIDTNGVVKNRYNRPIKSFNNGKYIEYKLYKDGEKLKASHLLLHRLLGIQFILNPENKPTIDHIDQNKLNNDLSNLRWATHIEQHANMSTSLHFETADERRLYENKRKSDWRVRNKIYLACAKELRNIER
jgi:hypothetical protein